MSAITKHPATNERRDQIIAILATALARLARSGPRPPEKPPDSGQTGLEVRARTSLTGARG